jgi:hypothetical protein
LVDFAENWAVRVARRWEAVVQFWAQSDVNWWRGDDFEFLSLVFGEVFGGVLARWPKLVEKKSPKMANFFKKRAGFSGKEGYEE